MKLALRRLPALAAASALLVACFGAASILPTADFAACVATDALAHKTLAVIVHDCGQDIPAVIASLFSSSDPAVHGSEAYGEAVRTQAFLKAQP